MSCKHIFLLISISAISFTAGSQTIYSEVQPSGAIPKNISIHTFKDSILLSYEVYLNGRNNTQSKWITHDSKAVNDLFSIDILQIMQHGNKRYYYFLEEKKQLLTLKALVEDSEVNSRKESEKSIQLPEGILLGHFTEENLFIINFNKKENRISITEVKGMEMVSQKVYNIPLNVANYLKLDLEFGIFDENNPINTFRGKKIIKFIKSEHLQIVIDKDSKQDGVYGQTMILTLGKDGTVQYNSIPSDGTGRFSSFLIENKLFRINTSGKSFIMTVWDLESKSRIGIKEIFKGKETFNVFVRGGKNNFISNQQTITNMMKGANVSFPTISVIKSEGRYIVQCGTYYEPDGVMGPGALNPVAGIIKMAAGTLILQAMDPPGVSQYFYCEFDPTTSAYNYANESSSFLRKIIDEYEISCAAKKITFVKKNYIAYKKGILASYLTEEGKNLELVYFE